MKNFGDPIMEPLEIFSAVLGLSPPWEITSVAFANESNRLDLGAEFQQERSPICAACRAEGTICHAEIKSETWHHHDLFNYNTYLHARVPHPASRCGLSSLERPWFREGSRFVRLP
jgi:hypothetical protein